MICVWSLTNVFFYLPYNLKITGVDLFIIVVYCFAPMDSLKKIIQAI